MCGDSDIEFRIYKDFEGKMQFSFFIGTNYLAIIIPFVMFLLVTLIYWLAEGVPGLLKLGVFLGIYVFYLGIKSVVQNIIKTIKD